MHHAVAQKYRFFKAGNHAEYTALFREGQMGLEAHQIEHGTGFIFPEETMIGAMAWYISHGGTGEFQPMNANFGILEPMETRIKGKKERYEALSARALAVMDELVKDI